MRRRILSAIVSVAMLASLCTAFAVPAAAAAKTPQYQKQTRQMEDIDRGLIAVYRTADGKNVTSDEEGVYLSWRLLGTESLENQAFDIYKGYSKITTTGAHDATNYIDKSGSMTDEYRVVPAGTPAKDVLKETPVKPVTNHVASGSGATALKQSFTYMDIPIQRPADVKRIGDDKTSYYYSLDKDHEGGANDASIGDLDGDGQYEIILKWDPTDSKDSAGADYTGNQYIDAYEIDPDNDGPMWRIDLGPNVTSGAHYTQFIVYDFDGDGKSEIAMKTAPGTKDGKGNYVSAVGDTAEIRNVDNEAIYVGTSDNQYLGTNSSRLKGKNPFVQYLTVFDGETGEALATTEYIPYDVVEDKYWGDGSAKYNRSERYLAGVAYLDGVHPSIIMCRGYYNDSVIRAYNWDGSELSMLWEHIGKKSAKDTTLYGQGNHNLSIGDIDNDGKDEIVYGSAALDDDGKTVLGNTKLGHGDAMHMSDFNNDGVQEVYSVKEDGEGYKYYAEDLRVPATGKHFWNSGKIVTSGDNGRGVMANIDDEYAKTHPNALALGWSSGKSAIHDLNGDDVATKPASAGNGSFDNFLVYWDGDLSRELLDANIIQKYDASTGYTTRFWGEGNGYTLTGGTTNNYTKRNAALVADLWGDWREEIIMSVGKGKDETPALRIFTSTIPTDYRLTTLMHDSQYRLAIAWQNVGYNQPPHQSYYIGSVALATDDSGNALNYLAPAVPFTNVTTEAPEKVSVTGISIDNKNISLEKNKSATIGAKVLPENASKKGISWGSSDTDVATVSNGVVKGVNPGRATITATTKDGGFTDTCEVEVFSKPVTGISLSNKLIEMGVGSAKKLSASVYPIDATDTSVKWSSADSGIASVSADGTVTGNDYGKTTITATTNDGNKVASCIVKVKPMSESDATGSGVFEFVGTVPEGVTLDPNTATGATMVVDNASGGAAAQKVFDNATGNKAILKFNFVTGGTKLDNTNWNWTGHEYSMGLKFLDKDGNNIMNIVQPYTAKAGTLTCTTGDDTKTNVENWTKVVDGIGNIQGSAKRWVFTAEFDYEKDTCKVDIMGTDATFETNSGEYTHTFTLNGAKLSKMQLYTTQDGTGTVKATPAISNLSYGTVQTVDGTTTELYNKGSESTAWQASDVTETDWKGAAVDTANDRIVSAADEAPVTYEVSKSFDVADNAIVNYDVDWYFTNNVGNGANVSYLQIGDNLRLGWFNDYSVCLSIDGGATWVDSNSDGAKDILFQGENRVEYTKNVKVTFDKKTNKATLTFEGNKIGEYTFESENADSVKYGFTRGGSITWAVPNGIDRIRVSQFAEGEEGPDINSVKLAAAQPSDTKTVNVKYGFVTDENKAALIGVLYDGDKVKEIQTAAIEDLTKNVWNDASLTFNNDTKDYTLRLFMWDDLNGMVPIGDEL